GPEDQPDALAASEEHGVPGELAVLRFSIQTAQADLAHPAHREPDAQHDGEDRVQDEEPSEFPGDEGAHFRNGSRSGFGIREHPDHHGDNQYRRDYPDQQAINRRDMPSHEAWNFNLLWGGV